MRVIDDWNECDVVNNVWSGAVNTVKYLSLEEVGLILMTLEECYPEGMTTTQLNDFFWFEDDTIAKWLGYNNFEEIMEREDN